MKRRSIPFIAILLLLSSSRSWAQTLVESEGETPAAIASPEKENRAVVRFAAVVQYVDGSIERVDASKARAALAFGAAIYEDERIQLGPDATLKIVTRQECVVVFHGEGLALAANREKPWRAKSAALRWICPEGKSETFVFQNLRYKLTGGEVLFEGPKLLMIAGQLRSSRTPEGGFSPRTLYTAENGAYLRAAKQSERTNWELNRSRKPPKETTKWAEPVVAHEPPEPAREKRERLLVGPFGAGGMIGFDVTPLGKEDLSGDGGRLQYHQKLDSGRSLVTAISLREFGTENRHGGSLSVGSTSIDTFAGLLEFGLRTQHDRIFSSFFRVGGGYLTSKIKVNRSDIGFASETEYEFYVASLTGGFDAIYCPSWLGSLGLNVGLEGQLLQSLGRGAKNDLDNFVPSSYPEESREPWSLTAFSVNLMLGLVYEF
ncbi:MAG: hypothetical protein V4760_16445 [Bdellovibrionota bacterium]